MAVRVLVEGRVQGVGFRESCRRQAASRGLRGWVRNLPDGRVEAVFAGDDAGAEPLASMVAWCRRGPLWARVDNIDVVTGHLPCAGEEPPADGFEVR